jgi:2'-5' RNA ligase
MIERLFFALWPDDVIRDAIARGVPAWTARLDGRRLRPDQWHVTLEFIGAVGPERRASLQAVGDSVPLRPCEIVFDRCEFWRKPQVACLVATRVPEPLAEFVTRLRAALAAAGFDPDSRPYRPHVTLARKVAAAAAGPIEPPLHWPASSCALVRSTSDAAGSRYEPVHWCNEPVRGG